MVLGLVFSLGGLVVLTLASDQFVKGAARLAVIFRVAPVIVGAVIVGFGTSAPEMVVSGLAAVDGNLDIGVGNVIGSNVANISLVLAATSFVAVIPVQSVTLRREAPISVASVLVFAGLIQGDLDRREGAVLAVLLVCALLLVLRAARPDDPLAGDVGELLGDEEHSTRRETVRTSLALVTVAASAWFIVEGAIRVADELNLSGGFVGFTLVAVGTSAPELVTALAAARQGETELLIGNLLGSNVFNSLAVGGVIGLVGPGPVLDTRLAQWGSVLMVAIVVISWLMMMQGGRVTRRNGIILICMWIASVVILSGGDALEDALALIG
ncbi:MAG: sodium:calcium antiporter [Acidimicrobiales bacterium]|jgi:cation:H+ antiporter|nr:sodium:calcium antiporter [Acidimicrobiales bacterium]